MRVLRNIPQLRIEQDRVDNRYRLGKLVFGDLNGGKLTPDQLVPGFGLKDLSINPLCRRILPGSIGDISLELSCPSVVRRLAHCRGQQLTGSLDIAPINRQPTRDDAHLDRMRVGGERVLECALGGGGLA